ncbi:MAG: NAD-dependent epimerase/dehydratase family protein [Oscillospiraceae bacterium]|nr:NAD-dependent epimerase/dehydratase family protein [Oscillospiraceae bacterium]
MKVLFIGGTGLIGTAVGQLLTETPGVSLTALHRGNSAPLFSGARMLNADARDPASLRRVLGGEYFDVVVNWIAFTPEHVRQDIDMFTGRTGQYVFISSASAYQKPLMHYRITESTPLTNRIWRYSEEKAECEALLQHSALPCTIIRPSHTYGLGNLPFPIGARHPYTPIKRILDGKPVILHGDGTSLWTITHHTDFAQGMAGLLGQPRAVGQEFHITSDEALSWNNIVRTVGGALGVEPKLVHLPSALIERKLPGIKGHLLGDKAESVIFDNSKLKDFVPGYQARVTFAEGVRRCLRYYDSHEKLIDEEYDRDMDMLTELAEKIYAL